MGQKASIVILVGFLLAGGLLVLLKTRGQDTNRTAADPAAGSIAVTAASGPVAHPAQRIALPVLYSSEKEEWLRTSVGEFEKAHPEIEVRLQAKGSLEAVRAL